MPSRESSARAIVRKTDVGQSFRKRAAPIVAEVGKVPAGPDDPFTRSVVTRNFSDGTVHTIAFQIFPQTEAGVEPLTCVTEWKGVKEDFPKVISGPKKRLAVEGPEADDQADESEYQPAQKSRKKHNAVNSEAEKARKAALKAQRADRAARRAKRAEEAQQEVVMEHPEQMQRDLPSFGEDELAAQRHLADNGSGNERHAQDPRVVLLQEHLDRFDLTSQAGLTESTQIAPAQPAPSTRRRQH